MLYPKEKLDQLIRRWRTAKGKALLVIIRESKCYLSKVMFHENIHDFPCINDKEVADGIDLRGAPLSGFDFRIAVQDGDNGFLEEFAVISNIHFEGATLKHCKFLNGKIMNCNFENATLTHSDFRNSTINNCNFINGDLTGIGLHGTKIMDCNFTNCALKDVTLSGSIVDEKTTFGKTLKSEQEGNYHFASIEYKQIKLLYKNSSLHHIADHYQYKEMVAKRKISKRSSPKRWLNYVFGDLLCKYGTSYTRVFFWSAAIIILCGFMLSANKSLLYNNQPVEASLTDALYFSLVTFTTLGYGDFHAIGFMRFVAGLESFAGVFLMSLFTVIVGRRIIRD